MSFDQRKTQNEKHVAHEGAQLPLNLGHTPSLAEADFIVSDANEMAFEHIISYPDWPHPLTLISGPAKSGKSHLAKIWAERSGAEVACGATLEKLAVEGSSVPVLIEDIDLTNFDEAQIFHLLNQSIREARPLLMTAEASIVDWPFFTEDVRSRARLATSFLVRMPDDAQLAQMFAKLFDDRQIKVEPKIIAYLVSRMERSAEEVVALVGLMDDIAMSRNKPVSRKVASEALALRATIETD